MNYSDIIGQDHILSHIRDAVANDRVSHAYIIHGEDGSGKKSIAKLFAQTLLCEGENKPCQQCHSCKQALSDNHPDIKWITHEKPNTISVDDVRRQLNDDIVIKPYSGPYKVYIIPEAEKLGAAGQNAILKTIEEPPAYAVIILLTNNAAAFLPTIISRCVMLNIRPVQRKEMIQYLVEKKGLVDYQASVAAGFAGGNIGKAIKLATSNEFTELKDNVLLVVKHCGDMQISELVSAVRQVESYKMQVDDYLDLMTMWYRDILLYKATMQADQLIFQDEIVEISRQSSKATFEDVQNIINAIDKCKIRLKANVNFELAIELMFMTIREEMR